MEFQRPFFLLFLLTLLSSSQARKFKVGGSQGWVPNPSESYNTWAGRNRFQINDSIVFKYNKGSDSVLEVNKEDYDKCNKTKPIKKFENGDTEFTFDRSGPFYFISGNDGNCEKGQKLLVVVLSPRTPPSPKSPSPKISPSPSPMPKPNPPIVSPPAPSPTSPSPASSPAPSVAPPAASPGPAGGPPAASPGPATESPVPSPAATPPSTSPPAPTPEAATPPSSPGSSPPLSPGQSPSQTPSSNSTSPTSKNSVSCVSPSIVLVSWLTIVVGSALLRY
ncbi:hypothetical protein Fmac_021061 [Flemingia macrophylla]|uniref:Phytocyanin domain-containing protein n=1 Tax=Flemingia macrophylla TaxID=520843 RepID=A0ABD1LVR9_9FABA